MNSDLVPPLRRFPFIRRYCGRQVVSPHPSRALPVPPSPWGKATSGGGKSPLLGEGGSAKPRRVWGGMNSDTGTAPAALSVHPGPPEMFKK